MSHSSCILLFSGGLDSIIAARMLEKQGVEVCCIHFKTPFFGNPEKIADWKNLYGLNVELADVSRDFIKILQHGPEHGYGKTLNPCVDCKILLLKKAKEEMKRRNADFIATGEVLGQRPMSQRRDTLHLIQNKSETASLLLRPLSAQLLPPTQAENEGLVDRTKLGKISGRSRQAQLLLANEYQLPEIPGAAGGCELTDKEQARRYWNLLRNYPQREADKLVEDFMIMANGRLFYSTLTNNWLVIGRNKNDNQKILQTKTEDDVLIRVNGYAGPLALARDGKNWDESIKVAACELAASYATHAVENSNKVSMLWNCGEILQNFIVTPKRDGNLWFLPSWEDTHEGLKKFRQDWLLKKATLRG